MQTGSWERLSVDLCLGERLSVGRVLGRDLMYARSCGET